MVPSTVRSCQPNNLFKRKKSNVGLGLKQILLCPTFEKFDVLNSCLFKNNMVSLEELVERYNTTLTTALDNHAPVNQRVITLCPANPWTTDEI